jgi:GntR family histidine utilization transcriptional repressor
LQRVCPLIDARQELSAALPTEKEAAALAIPRREPCLLITRVTSARLGLVSFARILAPSSRYRLAGELHFSGRNDTP